MHITSTTTQGMIIPGESFYDTNFSKRWGWWSNNNYISGGSCGAGYNNLTHVLPFHETHLEQKLLGWPD